MKLFSKLRSVEDCQSLQDEVWLPYRSDGLKVHIVSKVLVKVKLKLVVMSKIIGVLQLKM